MSTYKLYTELLDLRILLLTAGKVEFCHCDEIQAIQKFDCFFLVMNDDVLGFYAKQIRL